MNDTIPTHPFWNQAQRSVQQQIPFYSGTRGNSQAEDWNASNITTAQLPLSRCRTTVQTPLGPFHNADQAEVFVWNSQEYLYSERGGHSAHERLQNIANIVTGTYVSLEQVNGTGTADEPILDNTNPAEAITQFLLPFSQADATDAYFRANGTRDSQASTSSGPLSSITDNSEVGEHISSSVRHPCDLCTKTFKLKRSLRYVTHPMYFNQLTSVLENIEPSMILLRKSLALTRVAAATKPSPTLKTASAICLPTIRTRPSHINVPSLVVDSLLKGFHAAAISSVTYATNTTSTHALRPVGSEEN